MNPTQKQAASLVLVAAYRQSGADMAHLEGVLDAAEQGDPVAARAIAADAMKVAHALEASGDPRYAVLLQLAAEFEAQAARRLQ